MMQSRRSHGNYERLDRALNLPKLAGIGISGCIGAGIFVSSGAFISTTGSLGAPIAYVAAGSTVACVLYTLTEMVACRPVAGAIIDIVHTFLGPAWGFTVGMSYALANICSMATLTAQSAELTAQLKHTAAENSVGVEAAVNASFIVLTIISHSVGVRLYGRIERVIMWFKICLLILVCILMIVVNFGGAGVRETSYRANYTDQAFTPGWKPYGFQSITDHSLYSSGVSDTEFGIGGSGGKFFAFLTAVTLATFSCMGGEMVSMTAGEALNPWKDVPLAQSFVYLVPLSIYPLAMISAGANVNYADPWLAKTWARAKANGTLSESPFVIAIQFSSIRAISKTLNAFFVISAYTAANTALWVSSRTVFVLAQKYFPPKLADILGKTNRRGTPHKAILLCGAFGALSLIGLIHNADSQPRVTLSELYTGLMGCIYICLCVTFLKFKAGLDGFEKRGILDRDDDLYRERLFKSRWQPLPAYIGMIGSVIVVIWSGIPPIYILAKKGGLHPDTGLKSTVALTFDIVGVYLGPVLFLVFYFAYKLRTHCKTVLTEELTIEDYIIEDLQFLEETGSAPQDMQLTGVRQSDTHQEISQLESPDEAQAGKHQTRAQALRSHIREISLEISPEELAALRAQRADKATYNRVVEILNKRPIRMEGGFWKVVWRFIVAEKEPEKNKRDSVIDNRG